MQDTNRNRFKPLNITALPTATILSEMGFFVKLIQGKELSLQSIFKVAIHQHPKAKKSFSWGLVLAEKIPKDHSLTPKS